MEQLTATIAAAVKQLFDVQVEVELTRPDEQFGDYATNVALQLAKKLGKNPREVAEQLVSALQEKLDDQINEITVAGPGFINFQLHDKTLWQLSQIEPAKTLQGQKIIAEYSDPNPFKVLHAGHLYTTVVGDVIAKLVESAGATVHRVNFGGDVGLHVGKTMWAIMQELGGEYPEKLGDLTEDEKLDWISARYVVGNSAYEDNDQAKQEIIAVNQRVYQLHADNDRESPFAQIYWTCRQWSYDGFEALYQRLAVTPFEKYYPESATTQLGLETVQRGLKEGVFEQSDGAVIFPGEKHGLHTRVFLTGGGLPTYEAKDLGLALHKWQDYHFDQNIIITAGDIIEYMKVVLAALKHFAPEVAERTKHLTHGVVKLAGGIKMSSRKGNILRATDILNAAAVANREVTGKDDPQVILAAVKYAFLKQRIGGDIIYDPAESVALEGNSGPYLQYAHARARSIVRKSPDSSTKVQIDSLEPGERSLVRKISEYPEVVDKAVQELMPHHICTYLYELAQTFNRFYEHNRVIGDPREPQRLQLVQTYVRTLNGGLTLLGISAPEHM